MAAFNSLGHIALKVRDLEASIAFYEKLGFPEFLRLLEEDGSPWIVYVQFEDNLYLELFPGGTERVDQKATGTNHLCLTVDDIEATARHLAAVGIPLTSPLDPGKRGLDRNRGMWIEDPDGNRIEIMEMADNCIQWEAIATLKAGGGKTALMAPSGAKTPKRG
jgi:catechol 2,3-dioxygenase-like lactoylglutathione lyase family enzyme